MISPLPCNSAVETASMFSQRMQPLQWSSSAFSAPTPQPRFSGRLYHDCSGPWSCQKWASYQPLFRPPRFLRHPPRWLAHCCLVEPSFPLHGREAAPASAPPSPTPSPPASPDASPPSRGSPPSLPSPSPPSPGTPRSPPSPCPPPFPSAWECPPWSSSLPRPRRWAGTPEELDESAPAHGGGTVQLGTSGTGTALVAAFEVVACKDMFSTGTALLAAFEVPCKDIYVYSGLPLQCSFSGWNRFHETQRPRPLQCVVSGWNRSHESERSRPLPCSVVISGWNHFHIYIMSIWHRFHDV